MDAGWNEFSTTNLNQIAQALGYSSVDDLPPLEQLTDAQILVVQERVGLDEALQLTLLRTICGTPGEPVLDEPALTFTDGSEIALLLMDLNSKLSDLLIASAQEGIKANKDGLKQKNEANIQKILDALDKMKDAKHSSLLAKIFGWIGVGAALIIGIASVVLTGGATAALVGLGIAAIGLALMTAQETGGMEKLMDKMFGDDYKAKTIFMISLQVFMLALSLSSMFLSGGATATIAVGNLAKSLNLLRGVCAVIGGASAIAGGTAGISAGIQQFDASQSSAEAKELQAWIAKLNALLEEEQENLKKILDEMQNGAQIVLDMLNGIAQSKDTIIQYSGV